MSDTETLAVPGAVLHFRIRGTGPMLLLSESGEGDADRSCDLVDQLTDTYTVVTYDRRGLSRSRLDDQQPPASLDDHADDVRRLLESIADGPVLMLGCSLGAVIGSYVVIKHPGLVRTLIAHEPVAPRLLPEPGRSHHVHELAAIQQRYVRDGLSAVLPQLVRTLGIDPDHRNAEPDVTQQPIDGRRIPNFDYFLRHDFAAVIADKLDWDAMRAVEANVIPAVGSSTQAAVFDRRCAIALGELVGRPVVEFPGGHNGNTSHPRGYATRLREVLAEATDLGSSTAR